MPLLNGIEMSKEIQAINADIPIIFLSAHNEPKYSLENIGISVGGFIYKPIKMDNFLTILDRVIS